MNMRRWLAKALFYGGGYLSKIKVPTRTYLMEWDDVADEPTFTALERRWMSNSWALALVTRSERYDPQHWEHWALTHNEAQCTDFRRCQECGGAVCAQVDEPHALG
jgi:hypothetical protein